MYYIKLLVFIGSITTLALLTGCDKELKEHPIPASLKRQLDMQNDPTVQSKKISGTLTVDAKLASHVSETATLFIFARPVGQESGPPLAVKRSSGTQFPYQYSIGQINTMLEGAKFEGELSITARLSREGAPKAAPGDLEGSITAQVGGEKVDIVLNRLIPDVTTTGAGGANP